MSAQIIASTVLDLTSIKVSIKATFYGFNNAQVIEVHFGFIAGV